MIISKGKHGSTKIGSTISCSNLPRPWPFQPQVSSKYWEAKAKLDTFLGGTQEEKEGWGSLLVSRVVDITFFSLMKEMGLIHGSFDGRELEIHPIYLREGMVGKLRFWFYNLYSPTWGEVYETMALPLDSPLQGTSLGFITWEDITTIGFTTLEDVTTLGFIILEVEGVTKGIRHVFDKKSS